MDGIGYGLNGAIWGEEVLKLTFRNFERAGHLEEIPMHGVTYAPVIRIECYYQHS